MARITYYTATVKRQAAHDAHFHCSACGFASPVRCWAEVSHSATSTINDPERLGRQAAEGAESRSRIAAVQRFEQLWCPHCGQRSPADAKRLERLVRKRYIMAVVLAVVGLALVIGWAVGEVSDGLATLAVVPAIGVVLSLVEARKHAASRRAKVIGVPQPFVQFAAAPPPPQAQQPYPMQAAQRM